MKLSVEVFPPLWTAFLRFVLGAACVYAWCLFTRQAVWPQRHEWRALCVISALFAVQIGTMNIGYANTTGVMGAVLIASNPVFAVVFAHFLVSGDRLHLVKAVGLALGFAGTALVLLEEAGPGLLRVHRSYAVNMAKAEALLTRPGSRYALSLVGGAEAPVGRSRVDAVRDAMSR